MERNNEKLRVKFRYNSVTGSWSASTKIKTKNVEALRGVNLGFCGCATSVV